MRFVRPEWTHDRFSCEWLRKTFASAILEVAPPPRPDRRPNLARGP